MHNDQNTAIGHLKATYIAMIKSGEAHIIAKALKPAAIN